MYPLRIFVFTAIITAAACKPSAACTRVLYQGPDNTVMTGRTMDWSENPHSNLWLFPRGMKRSGAAGANSIEWRSKYGSVVTAAYDLCTTDGMNEKGLVANLLWLAESEYPALNPKRPALSISAWAQYVLDNFATVDEAVTALSRNEFDIITDKMPDGSRTATLHLSISDATGDSAIFEYINGELQIHHSRAYTVMTNSPVFDRQLALDDYWNNIGGLIFLPGTNRAADRFVRASFYIGIVPKTADMRTAAAALFGVIRNVSVPFGISTPAEPNIASTRWRTVADQKNMRYFYESTLYPFLLWVDFKGSDFSEGAQVKVLNPEADKEYTGDCTALFTPSAPFVFQSIGAK